MIDDDDVDDDYADKLNSPFHSRVTPFDSAGSAPALQWTSSWETQTAQFGHISGPDLTRQNQTPRLD